MKIENTFDELLHAATLGFPPDDADLDAVRAPAGEDPAQFRAAVRQLAVDIASALQDGHQREAARLAEAAQAAYLAKFEQLMPVPAGGQGKSARDAVAEMYGETPVDDETSMSAIVDSIKRRW